MASLAIHYERYDLKEGTSHGVLDRQSLAVGYGRGGSAAASFGQDL